MRLSRMIETLSTWKWPGHEEEREEILLFLQRVEASAGLSNRVCYCCNTQAVEDFMLSDAVWLQVCPENKFLCLSCVERTLGRDLRTSDFKPLRMNTAAIYFLKKCENLLESAYADLGVRLLITQRETE